MQNSSDNTCLLKLLEKKELAAREFGFYWEHLSQLLDQIRSECAEVQEASEKDDRVHLQEEIGDLILAAAAVAVFCDFDPHETMLKGIEKFQKRYDALVTLAQNEGHDNLRQQPFDVLIAYWKRAKQL